MKKTIPNSVLNHAAFAFLLLFLSSCMPNQATSGSGERVRVSLGLSLSAPVNGVPDTRATGNASFYNLWAFQFDAAGQIVGTPQQLSNSQTAVGEGKNLTVDLTVGQKQTIYLFSAGKKLAPNLADIKTREQLEKYKLNYISTEGGGYSSAIINTEDIPYAGCIAEANVISLGQGAGMLEYNSPEGFAGSIGMKQLVAKVTLRYKYNADTHTLQGVRLQNVNTHVSPGNRSPYTPANGTEFRLFNLQLGIPDAQGYHTASWYVAQNLQGTNTAITSETDRYYKEGMNLAPQYGLCFEVLGRNKQKPSEYSVHRIFIGNNNTTNFDVEANHHYTLTTEFNSAYMEGNTDPRLDVTEFTTARISFCASARTQTSLCNSNSGEKYDLDAHYDWRPISIEASGCTVDIGIYSDAACTNYAQPGNALHNWLKLSVEPNYTLAVNNRTSPLINRMKVDVRAPSKLKFYLYNDEYVNVNEDNTSSKRSLYVKITTTELDASNPKTTADVFRVDQRPVWVAGQYGGIPNERGEYPLLLGIDRIHEYNNSYTDEAFPKKSIYLGYASDPKYMMNNGKNEGWLNGLQTTIRYAENPDNKTDVQTIPNDPEADIALPVKIGGKVDLYQYTYYNAFASRYCYDRNRDLDGSGALENPNSRGENEVKWYVAGTNQYIGVFGENRAFSDFGSSYCIGSTNSFIAYPSFPWIYNTITTAVRDPRCVRDLSAGKLPTPKLTTEVVPNTNGSQGGSQYSVITCPRGVDRNTEADFYVEIPLYAKDDDTNPMTDDRGEVIKVRRVKRHISNASINVNCSKKFAVSPIITSSLTWMHAGGWANNAEGNDLSTQMAVNTGCPAYTGVDGKDTPGTWRLPLLRELHLMTLCNWAENKTSSTSLWSATESGTNANYVNSSTSYLQSYNSSKTSNFSYRCIRDLP